MQNTTRDYSLTLNDTNVLKGIAICMMLWHHLFLEHRDLGVASFKLALTCKLCVAIFVFVSGYGLSVQFSKIIVFNYRDYIKESLRFILKRYVKFYLNYWVIFLIAVPLGIFVFNRPLEAAYGTDVSTIKSFIMDFFGLMGFKSYNATWWFNRLIIVLYLMFPLLFAAMRSRMIAPCLLLLLFVWPNFILFPLNELAPAMQAYLKIFCIGILIPHYIKPINQALSKIPNPIIPVAALLLTIGLSYLRNHVIFLSFFGNKIDPFFVLTLWLTITGFRQIVPKDIKPLEFLGKHSSNIYLTHTLLFAYFFPNFFYQFGHPILIFTALLICSTMLSVGFEFIKKITYFYNLQNAIINKITTFQRK